MYQNLDDKRLYDFEFNLAVRIKSLEILTESLNDLLTENIKDKLLLQEINLILASINEIISKARLTIQNHSQ